MLGPPEPLATELAADPALCQATDLLVSVVPGVPEFDEDIRLFTAGAVLEHRFTAALARILPQRLRSHRSVSPRICSPGIDAWWTEVDPATLTDARRYPTSFAT
ncbi:hypothetical protein ACWDKQ_16795 [Saccharopolyspora sp. NPDC000995]